MLSFQITVHIPVLCFLFIASPADRCTHKTLTLYGYCQNWFAEDTLHVEPALIKLSTFLDETVLLRNFCILSCRCRTQA